MPKIAIECDGASYHSSREAYLYDLHRQRILESCGFVFYRIWSTNWFRNTKREEEKLVAFIEKVEAEYIHGSKAESFDQSFTDDVILKPNKIRPSRNLFSEVKEVSDEPIKQGQSKKPLKEEKRATPEKQESENIAEPVVGDQSTPVVQNVTSGIRQEELTFTPRQEVQVIEKDCVNKLSKVKVLYLNNGKEIIVELADFLSNKPVANDGNLRIKNDTPLAKSIIGKAIGDTVQVGKGDYFVQILELIK